MATVKRRNLQWYGHVFRSSGLAKTILQGPEKGGRRQYRQKKEWEDDIREWTGLEFAKSQRALEDREKWGKLVAKSSVVPQRPSRLRDKWWWCMLTELYPFIPLWVTLSIFHGHSSVRKFELKFLCSDHIKLKLCRTVNTSNRSCI